MAGSASMESMTTEAPIMPVVAAMIVPMIATPSAKPPGTRLNSICRQRKRSAAILLFSSTMPIKMKSGAAMRTMLSAAPPQIRNRKLKNSRGRNKPRDHPIKPKMIETPPKTNPTGNPEKKSAARTKNIKIPRLAVMKLNNKEFDLLCREIVSDKN